MGAGKYDERFRHHVFGTVKDADNGQDVKGWTEGGILWGSIESLSGRQGQDYGAEETGGNATIRLRGYPSVKPEDKLEALNWNETYIVETVVRGDNERVCEVHYFDELVV